MIKKTLITLATFCTFVYANYNSNVFTSIYKTQTQNGFANVQNYSVNTDKNEYYLSFSDGDRGATFNNPSTFLSYRNNLKMFIPAFSKAYSFYIQSYTGTFNIDSLYSLGNTPNYNNNLPKASSNDTMAYMNEAKNNKYYESDMKDNSNTYSSPYWLMNDNTMHNSLSKGDFLIGALNIDKESSKTKLNKWLYIATNTVAPSNAPDINNYYPSYISMSSSIGLHKDLVDEYVTKNYINRINDTNDICQKQATNLKNICIYITSFGDESNILSNFASNNSNVNTNIVNTNTVNTNTVNNTENIINISPEEAKSTCKIYQYWNGKAYVISSFAGTCVGANITINTEPLSAIEYLLNNNWTGQDPKKGETAKVLICKDRPNNFTNEEFLKYSASLACGVASYTKIIKTNETTNSNSNNNNVNTTSTINNTNIAQNNINSSNNIINNDSNNTVSVSMPKILSTIKINKGWNLLSSPINGKAYNLSLLSQYKINPKYVFQFNVNKNAYEYTDIIDNLKGYWIYSFDNLFIPIIETDLVNSNYKINNENDIINNTITNKWNLLGTSLTLSKNSLLNKGVKSVWAFDTNTNNYSTNDIIDAGFGFWIKK